MSNAFMSSFIDSAIALKVSAAQKASDWFAPQIDKIRADLRSFADNLAQFQLETNFWRLSDGFRERTIDRRHRRFHQVQGRIDRPADTIVGARADRGGLE